MFFYERRKAERRKTADRRSGTDRRVRDKIGYMTVDQGRRSCDTDRRQDDRRSSQRREEDWIRQFDENVELREIHIKTGHQS